MSTDISIDSLKELEEILLGHSHRKSILKFCGALVWQRNKAYEELEEQKIETAYKEKTLQKITKILKGST